MIAMAVEYIRCSKSILVHITLYENKTLIACSHSVTSAGSGQADLMNKGDCLALMIRIIIIIILKIYSITE